MWKRFDELVAKKGFVSTREALRELEDLGGSSYDWALENASLFTIPDAKEGAFVATIYAVPHFQANMERQKVLRGGRNADPFLIARAAVTGSTVLTMEQFKDNAAKIPSICKHFGVACVDPEEFMQKENWIF